MKAKTKTKTKLFIITGLSLLSSLAISWNSSAINKNNLNIIYDETPTDSVSFKNIDMETGERTNASAKYTSTYNFLSEASENPSTFDNITFVAGASVLVVALALVILYSNSRRGFSKKACFALVLAVLGIFGGAFALSRNDKIFADEHSVQTITIKDKAFYDALKYCLSNYDSSFSDDSGYQFDDVNYDSDYYKCVYTGDDEDIVFNDELQTIAIDPYYVYSLDMHNKGISDISDLLNFKDLEYFFAYNNNITDTSILTEENFPELIGYIAMDYNHLSDVNDADGFLMGTLMAQSIDIRVDSDGNAELPGIFHKAMDFYIDGFNSFFEYNNSFDLDTVKIPVHVHNLELSDDLKTAHVINPGKKAYLGFSFDEDKSYYGSAIYPYIGELTYIGHEQL